MKTPLDAKIISSFLLYIDHEIQDKGEAFKNITTQFYPTRTSVSNTYTYTSPQKPFCNDVSISGANILSGVYLGDQFVTVGQSGLASINHYKGAITFTGQIPSNIPISGAAALKEISVKLTDKPDWKLMFETQYISNGSHPVANTTGISLDTEISPAIFIRNVGQENQPFAFSRLDNQVIYFRAVVVADNEFQKVAVTSILKNLNWRTFPVVNSTPFDQLGNMTGINYDYRQLSSDSNFTPIILSVKIIDVPQKVDYKDIIRNMAIADFKIGTVARS